MSNAHQSQNSSPVPLHKASRVDRRRQRTIVQQPALLAIGMCAATIATVAACSTEAETAGDTTASAAANTSIAAPTSGAAAAVAPSPLAQSQDRAPDPAPTSAAPDTHCTASQLAAHITERQGAAGSQFYDIALRNTAATPCTAFGFPGLSAVTPAGEQLGQAATRSGDSPHEILVGPGQATSFTVRVSNAHAYDPASCSPVTAAGLRIYPPNDTGWLDVAQQVTVCGDPQAGSVLQVYPVN